MAHCEIFVLNFNGLHFLAECLNSLRSLDSSSHTYCVNVIDNGSTDGSVSFVRENFPEVNVIALGRNYGFAKGNNLGVKHRKKQLRKAARAADILVFLNNDTAVEKSWLSSAMEVFEKQPDVGIVGSKAVFYDQFALITILTAQGYDPQQTPDISLRRKGLFLSSRLAGSNVYADLLRTRLPGAFSFPAEPEGVWLAQESKLYAAAKDPGKPAAIEFTLVNLDPELNQRPVEVFVNGARQSRTEYLAEYGNPQAVCVELESSDFRKYIQNAGSYLTHDWLAGDRGFLEEDNGQFDSGERVASVCGVSLFIRESLWRKLGGFDEHYFAYYEDTDLSLRARLAGSQCVYCPESIVRHVHCGSSGGRSDYFTSSITFSHFIFASKMMNRRDWKNRRKLYRVRAAKELELFEQDHLLDHKPFLRAYCRYIKRFPSFLRNRVFNLWNKPEKLLFGADLKEPGSLRGTADSLNL